MKVHKKLVLVGFFKNWYHMIHLSPLYPEMPLDMMESDLKNFYAPGALCAGGNRYPLSSSLAIAGADGADDRGNIKEAFAEMKWLSNTKNPSIRTAALGAASAVSSDARRKREGEENDRKRGHIFGSGRESDFTLAFFFLSVRRLVSPAPPACVVFQRFAVK